MTPLSIRYAVRALTLSTAYGVGLFSFKSKLEQHDVPLPTFMRPFPAESGRKTDSAVVTRVVDSARPTNKPDVPTEGSGISLR